jgi:hypothetical protein
MDRSSPPSRSEGSDFGVEKSNEERMMTMKRKTHVKAGLIIVV